MSHIAIPIPRIPGEQEIIVDVRINGVAQQFSYKIEMFTGPFANHRLTIE